MRKNNKPNLIPSFTISLKRQKNENIKTKLISGGVDLMMMIWEN